MSDSVSEKNKSLIDDAEALATAERLAAEARRTIEALIQALRSESARPEDPHAVRIIADLEVKLHAAEAVIARSAQGRALADGSVAIAAGKVLASEILIRAAEGLFELTGSQEGFAALDDISHDPVRWTFHAIGDVVVNGAKLSRPSQS